jgi:hypothetical protein
MYSNLSVLEGFLFYSYVEILYYLNLKLISYSLKICSFSILFICRNTLYYLNLKLISYSLKICSLNLTINLYHVPKIFLLRSFITIAEIDNCHKVQH